MIVFCRIRVLICKSFTFIMNNKTFNIQNIQNLFSYEVSKNGRSDSTIMNTYVSFLVINKIGLYYFLSSFLYLGYNNLVK